MEHELKIWPQYYCRVADGSKTFEVRDNDRGFQSGDTVVLKEWDPEPISVTNLMAPKGFTDSQPLKFKIGYMLPHGSQVIFSLLPFPKAKSAKKKTNVKTRA